MGDIDVDGHGPGVYRFSTVARPQPSQAIPSPQMTDPSPRNVERIMLGVAAALLVGAGAIGMAVTDDPGWPGIVLRSGIILAAIWFALPSLTRLSQRAWITIAIPALVLLFRPRLILWGLALGVAFFFASRKWKA